MMFIGTYMACNEIVADAYYFNTFDKEILFLNKNTSYPINKITKIEPFLKLGYDMYKIGDKGKSNLSIENY